MDVCLLVGLNLRRLRIGRGLTQAALAALVKLEPSHIGHIERGSVNMTLKTLEKLTGALSIEPATLFDRSVEAEPKPNTLQAGRKRKVAPEELS